MGLMDGVARHEAQVTVIGEFDLDEELLDLLGDALEDAPGIIDPILSINRDAKLLEISAEVETDDPTRVLEQFRAAVGQALAQVGAVETWRPNAPREAVIA